jgi:DNA-binding beta-propeller fold protein YncE
VKVFDNAGNFLFTFGAFGTGDGQFGAPQDIVVDDDRDRVAVTDFGNNRVQVFDLAGNFQFAFTADALKNPVNLAIDEHGSFYVTHQNGSGLVHVFDGAGNYSTNYSSIPSAPVAVGANDKIYVNGSLVFNKEGEYLYSFGNGGQVAIDDASGRIYVANGSMVNVWQLVPEPSSVALLIFGSVLGLMRFRLVR